MKIPSLKIRRVTIHRAPGFESGGLAVRELTDGINIVYGPNASGKTTLVHAIFSMLWPEESGEKMLVSGAFLLGSDVWDVEVEHGRGRYQCDGREETGPPTASVVQRDRYRLSLHDLLQHETRNKTFAESVMRESAGGYDLQAAVEDLNLASRPSSSRIAESKEAQSALENVRETEREMEQLNRDQGRLPALKSQMKNIQAANQRLKLIGSALEYAVAEENFLASERKIKTFPPVMPKVKGDEYTDWRTIEEEIRDSESRNATARREAREAEDKLKEINLPPGGLPAKLLSELRHLKDELLDLEKDFAHIESEIRDVKKRADEALRYIGDAVAGDQLEKIDHPVWGELAGFAVDLQKLLSERQSLTELHRVLIESEREDAADPHALFQAARALEEWLAASVESEEEKRKRAHWAVIAIVSVAASGAVLGVFAPPLVFLAALGAVSLISSLGIHRALRNINAHESAVQKEQQRRFGLTGVQPPAKWEHDGVRHRLMEIYDLYSRESVAEEKRRLWKVHEAKLTELDEKTAKLNRRRKSLVKKFGVAPETGVVELATLSDHVSRWQDENSRLKGLEERRESLKETKREKLKRSKEIVRTYGYDEVSCAAEGAAAFEDLSERQVRYEKTRLTLDSMKKTMADADVRLKKLMKQRDDLFAGLGLETGDDAGLRELCAKRKDFLAQKAERDDASAVRDNAEKKLRDHQDFDARLLSLGTAELEEELRGLKEQTAAREEIQKEIAAIEARVEEAGKHCNLENALTEKERALDALEEKLNEDYSRMVGYCLAENLKQGGAGANRPAVFDRARDILIQITRGRYNLEVDGEDGAEFRAHDTVKGRGFALDELSSATRVQLLMAVRMAFVETQERAAMLPLILDETLANTDDGKAVAVIESAVELARSGRQVFYLTAQGDEVSRWRYVLERSGDVNFKVQDLGDAELSGRGTAGPDVRRYKFERVSPPSPEGVSHSGYGHLVGAPPFDPRQGSGGVHIWYVVDDLHLLRQLLGLDIKEWGRLKNLMDSGQVSLVSDNPEVLDRLRQNGAALETFVQAYSRGRGKPVDRRVLEDSGAVSETFIREVDALAKRCRGEGGELIQALKRGEVSGFRSAKTDELEAYFEDHGYIDPAEQLEPDEVRRRMVHRLVRLDLTLEEAAERIDILLGRIAERRGEPEKRETPPPGQDQT